MLQGRRVKLRPLEKEDLPTIAAFSNDVALTLLADDDPPVPKTVDDLEKEFGEFKKSGDVVLFVIEVDGKVIGDCGLHHMNQHSQTASFGINIANRDYWSKGYGREAVSLLIDYVFRLRNFRRMWLTVYADNERAIRSYKSLGFVEEGRLRQHVFSDGEFKDWVYMGLLRSEWEPDEDLRAP